MVPHAIFVQFTCLGGLASLMNGAAGFSIVFTIPDAAPPVSIVIFDLGQLSKQTTANLRTPSSSRQSRRLWISM